MFHLTPGPLSREEVAQLKALAQRAYRPLNVAPPLSKREDGNGTLIFLDDGGVGGKGAILAKITLRVGSNPFLYSWAEQTISPAGVVSTLEGGRSGAHSTETHALELTNASVDVDTYVLIRQLANGVRWFDKDELGEATTTSIDVVTNVCLVASGDTHTLTVQKQTLRVPSSWLVGDPTCTTNPLDCCDVPQTECSCLGSYPNGVLNVVFFDRTFANGYTGGSLSSPFPSALNCVRLTITYDGTAEFPGWYGSGVDSNDRPFEVSLTCSDGALLNFLSLTYCDGGVETGGAINLNPDDSVYPFSCDPLASSYSFNITDCFTGENFIVYGYVTEGYYPTPSYVSCTGGSGGGDGGSETECCVDMPSLLSLYETSGCACVGADEPITLTYSGSGTYGAGWYSTPFDCAGDTFQFGLACSGSVWFLYMTCNGIDDSSGAIAVSYTCSPVSIPFSFLSDCCGGVVNFVVTE